MPNLASRNQSGVRSSSTSESQMGANAGAAARNEPAPAAAALRNDRRVQSAFGVMAFGFIVSFSAAAR